MNFTNQNENLPSPSPKGSSISGSAGGASISGYFWKNSCLSAFSSTPNIS